MRQLAAFIIIMMLVVFPSCKFLREKGFIGRKADTMAVWKVKHDSIRVVDSIRKVQARFRAIETARLDSINRIDKERMEWENKYRYNIILGSFITPEYARSFSAGLSQKGYKTRILKLEGTKFEMVSAEALDNFRDAVKRLKQFQDTVATDAWLYIYTKK
jgi:hypothetical protein